MIKYLFSECMLIEKLKGDEKIAKKRIESETGK